MLVRILGRASLILLVLAATTRTATTTPGTHPTAAALTTTTPTKAAVWPRHGLLGWGLAFGRPTLLLAASGLWGGPCAAVGRIVELLELGLMSSGCLLMERSPFFITRLLLLGCGYLMSTSRTSLGLPCSLFVSRVTFRNRTTAIDRRP
jgi:hypothetical protein